MCESDDVLFRVLEIQTAIADDARRRGRFRPASACLAKAYQEGAKHAKAGQPAGRFACASCRLQSCANLSSCGKHSEALEEACAAVLEIDKMWADITKANAAGQAAIRDNRNVDEALKRFPPGIRAMMKKPPKWLEKAVILSIEAKQCVALELEYCLRQSQPTSGVDQFELRTAGQNRPSSAPVVGSQSAQQSIANVAGLQQLKNPWELISRLISEAASMAETLFPSRHEVVARSRRVQWQAQQRHNEIENRVVHEAPDEPPRSDAAEDMATHDPPPPDQTEAQAQTAGNGPAAADTTKPDTECTEIEPPKAVPEGQPKLVSIDATCSNVGLGPSDAAPERTASKSAALRELALRESIADIADRQWLDNTQANLRQQISPLARQNTAASDVQRAASAGARRSRHAGSPGGGDYESRDRNLFKEWLENNSKWQSMSYLQQKMATEPGLQDLKARFVHESHVFNNVTLNDKHPDDLYELRTQFNASQVAHTKRQQKRSERHQQEAKQKSDKPAAAEKSTSELGKVMVRQWKSLYSFHNGDNKQRQAQTSTGRGTLTRDFQGKLQNAFRPGGFMSRHDDGFLSAQGSSTDSFPRKDKAGKHLRQALNRGKSLHETLYPSNDDRFQLPFDPNDEPEFSFKGSATPPFNF